MYQAQLAELGESPESQEAEPESEQPPEKDYKALTELARERASLRRERERAKAAQAKHLELDRLKTENPLAYLDAVGLTVDDLVRAQLTGKAKPPEDPRDIELRELRDEVRAIKTESAQAKYTKAVYEIRSHVEAESERYPRLAGLESPEIFVELAIKRHYAQTGERLDDDEACAAAEGLLKAKARAEPVAQGQRSLSAKKGAPSPKGKSLALDEKMAIAEKLKRALDSDDAKEIERLTSILNS